MTNLTQKIDALQQRIDTTNTNLQTVITKLDGIHTALTSASGNIDAAPIVSAIEALRGSGSENTIRSINQSIWNIAGSTPGKSIADLHTLLTAQHAAIGVYLAAIGADTDATATAIGIPVGDATTTLLGVLYSVQYALTHHGTGDPNLLSVIYAINNAIGGIPNDSLTLSTVRGLIAQQTEATGKLLNPIAYPPVDVCEAPYVSLGYAYYQSSIEIFPGFYLSYPGTIASWPAPPAGFGISRVQDLGGTWLKLNTGDWTDYRIYVSSTATTFGVTGTSAQRLPTNTWLNLAMVGIFGNDMLFIVEGSSALKVYICPFSQLVGGVAPTGTDFTSSTGTSVIDGRRYLVWPDLEGLTESAGGVELTPATSWTGYEVYVQTSASAALLHDITDPAQSLALAVNEWVALGANHTLAFSVDAAYLAKGYMQVPSTSSITVNSESVLSGTAFAIHLPGYNYDIADIIGDGSGHSFKFAADTQTRTSGGPGNLGDPRISYEPGGYRSTYPMFALDTWYHIVNATTTFGFYSFHSTFSILWADDIMPGSTAI